jgi:hypothetical protein
MEGAPERKALRERAVTLVMLEYLEATQPSGMPRVGKSADPGVMVAIWRETTILAGPTKAAKPNSRRDSETGHPHLVVAEKEDEHGAAETTRVVVGMRRRSVEAKV